MVMVVAAASAMARIIAVAGVEEVTQVAVTFIAVATKQNSP
jgi:hypothetical protein